jgi:hypothetical protein
MKRDLVIWLAAAALIAVGGFFVGRALKGDAEAGHQFEVDSPSYSSADLPQGQSHAGFTGFDEQGGPNGSILIAGRVASVSPNSITLSTSAGDNVIRLTGDQKLRILQPHQGPIPLGVTVLAIKDPGSDEATALLLLEP